MTVTLTDKITYKKLITASNDKIYYEDIGVAAGTMTELDTSGGAIDTSDQLQMFEGYQKVFVVNGTNLKVADFINTKLTHTELDTAHAKGDILTQGSAKMVVDFTNANKTATYGYVTAGTFVVTTQVTGSGSGTAFNPTGINALLTHAILTTAHSKGDILTQDTSGATMTVSYTDTAKTHTWGVVTAGTFDTTHHVDTNGSGSIFTPTSTSIRPPTWYTWTVYPGGASGTMPTQAYLGCLYKGRAVLAGDSKYPYQWYISRVANPWDWLYVVNDALSPVRGGNADAGEIGDIIRCLIPYKDDYLIFGCANSIWVLRGDPCAGGSLDEVDLTVGVFGAKSWCFDGDGNLYFWGTGGIYKLPRGFGAIENLTEISLPNLISDIAADSSTHRITMEYDRRRTGLFISVTKLSDGTNSCYWYDLKLGGFYPETYPEECGAYSLFYYDANDTDYKDLLVGCKDGYIRKFVDTAKNDDIGATDETISSYVALPVTLIGNVEEDKEGKLVSLVFELGGGLATTKLTHTALTTAHSKGDILTQDTSGATMIVHSTDAAKLNTFGHTTSGTFSTSYQVTGSGSGTAFTPTAVGTGNFADTDGLSYEVHVGDDAETVIEDIKDGAAAFASGTLSGAGRKTKIRFRARAMYIGIKVYNSTASETWVLNKVLGDIRPAGRLR